MDKSPDRVRTMFARIAPRYDRANHVMSLRLDLRWRRLVAERLLDRPGLVLDVASGTGDLAVELQRVGHRVVASDFTFEMLVASSRPIRQIAADALRLPFPDRTFDGATVGWGVRNFADASAGLREIRRVLRPGGILAVLDVSTPAQPLKLLFRIYFDHLMPLIGRLLTGAGDAYRYLRDSVREFPEGSAFLEIMESAGFQNVSARRLSAGIASVYRGEAR